ncbi:MAG: DNA primase [Verrucomicrobia bacterium]|nr:DNA primase [Verrucomicrobiota bacterium]
MAGLFSTAALEQIRAASDIVDVISAVLPLKRAGANFVALCPFHKEKTPSFNVNPHKQIFHCFGCHKGGDVFSFIQEYENISFTEAVRRLAERARIPLEFEKQPGAQQNRFLKETLLEIHERIAQRWHTNLLNDAHAEPARAYLARRSVAPDAVKLFRLGYAPDAWDDTVNWAKSKNYEWRIVEQAGLIIRKEGEDRYYDRFRGRLMFPICDEQGRVIGFSGRVIAGDEKTAKYVNSPETPIFTKGKVFFGLDKSKRAILDAGCAIVCEGQLDLIACYMADVRNIVAPQGTAFTADHARILKRYVDEVVLCFDSDTAGQAAAVRVLDSLLASGLAIRVATIPAPHDPDSYIKEFGGAAFQKLIGQAEGFFDYYLNHLCAAHDVNSDKGQMTVARAMAEAVQKTGHQVLVDKYAQKTALRLGIAPESMRAEFRKVSGKAAPPREAAETNSPAPPEAVPRPNAQEFWLLKLVLLNDDVIDWIAAHLQLDWVQHAQVREILSARLALHGKQPEAGVSGLMDQFEAPPVRSLISEALAENRPIPNPMQQLQDLALRLRNQFLDQQLARLVHRGSQPGTSDAERVQLLQQQQELRAAKRQPLKPSSA